MSFIMMMKFSFFFGCGKIILKEKKKVFSEKEAQNATIKNKGGLESITG